MSSSSIRGRHRALLPFLLLSAAASSSAPAQQPDEWNSARVMELMSAARTRRLAPQQDTLLKSYAARAEGFVYFYLDRRETEERTLVKTDQIALELYWAAPDRTRQRIVGMRDESRLPNRMHYHLDHLTVVQNGFGDLIRMGDGDEVADVPHPAAPGSDSIYQFRLADSLTLRLPGAVEPIRVYEIQVRPRRTDRAALVGSLFVDRAQADLVRMTFTFTPVSYVDRRLDYISVSLDNGLWEGRYWLPHEQTLQIRRQIPELDFAAGAVIQGRMRITDYTFNEPFSEELFRGPSLTAVPPELRERFEFERDLYAELDAEGLAAPPDLATIRKQAVELLGTRRLSGLPRWRPSLGSISSALRYNRAEGLAAGAGLTYAPGAPWRADFEGGFAFGSERPWGRVGVTRTGGPGAVSTLRLLHNDPRDLGIRMDLPLAVNTLTAAVAGRDYTDPFHASGARLLLTRRLGGAWRGSVEAAVEKHRSATLTQRTAPLDDSREFRPVLPVDRGTLGALAIGLYRAAGDPQASSLRGGVVVEAGVLGDRSYLRPVLDLGLQRVSPDRVWHILAHVSGGIVSGDTPAQRLFLLGGYSTLPGYPYRSFAGTRYGLLNVEASRAVLEPWLRLRGVSAAGAVGGRPGGDTAARQWTPAPFGGVRASAGAGVSLLWDLLRVDAVRGLGTGGEWQILISFHPEFRDIS